MTNRSIRLVRTSVAALCVMVTALARAQQGDAPAASFFSLLLPLLAVLGALLAALVWLNRSRGLYRNDGPLKVVQVVPVSPRERVVVLDSGTQWMVVGVASGRVSLLSVLDSRDGSVVTPMADKSLNETPPASLSIDGDVT